MQLAEVDNNQCCDWYARGDLCLGLIKWGVVKHKHGIVGLDQSLGLCLRETCPWQQGEKRQFDLTHQSDFCFGNAEWEYFGIIVA